MEKIRSYRDLRVWQAAMELTVVVRDLTLKFPREELFNLTNMMRRASIQIATHIASGHAAERLQDYLIGIDKAIRTLVELETEVETALLFKYISQDELDRTIAKTESLAKQLYSLRNSLWRRGDPNTQDP